MTDLDGDAVLQQVTQQTTAPAAEETAAPAGDAAAGGLWNVRTLWERVQTPVARGALLSVLLQGVGTVLAYPIQILVSRTLGVREYGTYAYALGLLNVATLVATLDLGGAALRFVGFYHAARDWALLHGFLRLSRRLAGGLSALTAIGGALVVVALGDRIAPGLRGALFAACVLLIPTGLLTLDLNLLQALRRVYETRVPNLFVRPIGFALVLWVATRLFHAPRTAAVAILANTAGTTAALVLSVMLLRRLWPNEARAAAPATRTSEWLRFSGMSLTSSIMYMVLSQQSDVIIVGSVIGTTDAGLYSAASQIASLVLFGVVTVNHFASPLLAEYQTQPTAPGLRRLVRRISLLNWAVSLPLVAVLLVVGPYLLRSFGREFGVAYPVLLVLLLSQVVNAIWGALWGTLLTMTGFQREASLLVVVVAVLNVALTAVLTPRYGIVGAATATCAAVLVRGALVAWVVRKHLGFWPVIGGGAVAA